VTSATPRLLLSPAAADGERQQFVHSLDNSGAWWTLFRSRQLSELMQRALRDNYDLKAAQAHRGFLYGTL
jgi:outer membrane protein TolC